MNVPRERCCARIARWGVRAVCAVGMASSLWGCEGLPSTTVSPGASPERRAASWTVDHAAYGELGYRLDWRGFPAVTSGADTVTQVAIEDDMILVMDRSSIVSALDPKDGSNLWRNELANVLTRFNGLGATDGMVIAFGQSDIYVVDPANGTLVDRQELGRVANTAPLILGDAVVYGTSRGELRLHSVRSRIEVWGNALWGNRLPGAIVASPVLVGGTVGGVTQTGEVFFVDPSTGSLVATSTIEGGLANDPVVEDAVMYVASLDQSIYAISSTSGAQIWRHRTSTPLTAQPTVHDGVLYEEIPGEGMTALDSSTGKVKWAAEGVTGQVLFESKGALAVWDGETVVRLDPDTGDVIGRVHLSNVWKIVPDGFSDPTLYVVSDQGVVGRFAPR